MNKFLKIFLFLVFLFFYEVGIADILAAKSKIDPLPNSFWINAIIIIIELIPFIILIIFFYFKSRFRLRK